MPPEDSTPVALRLDPRSVHDLPAREVARAPVRRRAKSVPESSETPVDELDLPPVDRPFHFTSRIWRLCDDVCKRLPVFAHIDMRQVLVTFVRCRNRQYWGNQAKLVPLRFRGGAESERRHGHMYRIQQFFVGETEMKYVLSFYLPRFLNQTFDEKMVTVLHELYHIDQEFSGDIRRFAGAHFVHTSSQKEYDRKMAVYVGEYVAQGPNRRLYDFLRLNFAQLQARYPRIVGVHTPAPKLIPLGR
jgi:hypothetical protein